MDHPSEQPYRGRIAPTPTGYLHLGHAATFGIAWARAREAEGTLVYREEDLDPQRCRPEYARAAMEDLRWLGLDWQEGPDISGDEAEPLTSYLQSERRAFYRSAWGKLRDSGHIYPSLVSRKELQELAEVRAPQEGAEEPIFPPQLRPSPGTGADAEAPAGANWRFRVPDGREVHFTDGRLGSQCLVAGRDFGDFLIWRRDDVPSYELAVVVDDAAMGITEIVRGEDLLVSAARQLLLYEALGVPVNIIPKFYHTPLLRDSAGRRLAKRHDALAIRELRERGVAAEEILAWIKALHGALEAGAGASELPRADFWSAARW